jgi:pimeloyl-ACP methyl ester carboxylesterase
LTSHERREGRSLKPFRIDIPQADLATFEAGSIARGGLMRYSTPTGTAASPSAMPTASVPPSLPPLAAPLGVAVFPRDIILPVRRLAERSFPNIVHWTEFDQGGHFAAMEEPDLFVNDLRAFARIVAQ